MNDSAVEDEGIAALREIMMDLPERERDILLCRSGWKNGHLYSLRELARVYQLSWERIRQLEMQGFRRLQDNERVRIDYRDGRNRICIDGDKWVTWPETVRSDRVKNDVGFNGKQHYRLFTRNEQMLANIVWRTLFVTDRKGSYTLDQICGMQMFSKRGRKEILNALRFLVIEKKLIELDNGDGIARWRLL